MIIHLLILFPTVQTLEVTIIQATVNVHHRLNTFKNLFIAGSIYSVSGFDVTRSNFNFKLSDSPVWIRFIDETAFNDLTGTVSPIYDERFRFRNHDELLGLAQTPAPIYQVILLFDVFYKDVHLIPDIIGELTAIKSAISNPSEYKNRGMAIIPLDKYVFLYRRFPHNSDN